jgi:transposase-like protein
MKDHLSEILTEDGCPRCGSVAVKPVKYTWWGGILGPKLFHHTKCQDCNYLFNSKTRKSNLPAIIIYSVALFVVAFAAFYALRNYFG